MLVRCLIIVINENNKVKAQLAIATSNLMDYLNKITNVTVFSTKTVNVD